LDTARDLSEKGRRRPPLLRTGDGARPKEYLFLAAAQKKTRPVGGSAGACSHVQSSSTHSPGGANAAPSPPECRPQLTSWIGPANPGLGKPQPPRSLTINLPFSFPFGLPPDEACFRATRPRASLRQLSSPATPRTQGVSPVAVHSSRRLFVPPRLPSGSSAAGPALGGTWKRGKTASSCTGSSARPSAKGKRAPAAERARTSQRQAKQHRYPSRRRITGAVTAPTSRWSRFSSRDATGASTPCRGESPQRTVFRRFAAGFEGFRKVVQVRPSSTSRAQHPSTWGPGPRRCSSSSR
jgi:hypothetical protein